MRLTLTRKGIEKLDALVEAHRRELAQLAPAVRALWQAVERHAASPLAGEVVGAGRRSRVG